MVPILGSGLGSFADGKGVYFAIISGVGRAEKDIFLRLRSCQKIYSSIKSKNELWSSERISEFVAKFL